MGVAVDSESIVDQGGRLLASVAQEALFRRSREH
jgi:acyl-CoA thioesterase